MVFWLGRQFHIGAWKQLKQGTSNMDTLVACSTSIAYIFSVFNLFFPKFFGAQSHVYFESAAGIIAFILIGRTLETKAKNHTTTAIQKLMGLQPKEVTIVTPEGETTLPISSVVVGNKIKVKPGERIAVDGTITDGSSYVDESMLSGEPMAVRKSIGSDVYAGTINQKGSFAFKATKIGADTVLAHIIHAVQEAQGSKAPIQRLVDKIASIFVPTIITISVITLLIWVVLAPINGLIYGILAMATVLIIACPCALGLATPTAIMVGIGKGAENGILIKGAESLEIAKNIDTIILDKTGTITEGNPKIKESIWKDTSKSSLLAAIESLSEHPLAEAITRSIMEIGETEWKKGTKQQTPKDSVSDTMKRAISIASSGITSFTSITGKGVKAEYDGECYYVGNKRLMNEVGIAIDTTLRGRDQSEVYFSNSHKLIAVLGISDTVKKTSAEAIDKMHAMGLDIYMLTGDNESTAASIANEVHIRHHLSGMLPAQKSEFIKKLQKGGKKVAMIGDGINDSAALAQADLSIAMGHGSDIAMETAMITILRSDLNSIPIAINLSKCTVRTIHENLFWAFIYNMIAIPIAAGILFPINGFLLNPMIGGAAMAFSSVSVVLNSLRLKHKKLAFNSAKDICNNHIIHKAEFNGTEHTITGNNKTETTMKKEFKVSGMMCQHCRSHVENALNSIHGVTATVTLDPAIATIEFTDRELSLDELQKVVTEKAGEDYKLY